MLYSLVAALIGLALFIPEARAQSAQALSQVKKVFVEPFAGKRGASEIREGFINRLKHDPSVVIVSSASDSDAVLKGRGEIWTTGYISTNPRASGSNRSPVYTGYLSLTLVGAGGQPLWSYMVTPSGSLSGTITSSLADHGARFLVSAVAHEKEAGPSRTPSAAAVETIPPATLKGAGSTFIAPLYQEWLQSFHQLHPGITVTYDAIGSEGGTQRLLERKTDFAASDIATSPADAGIQRFATVIGAVVPIYNLHGIDRELHFTPEVLTGIYLGKITRWSDPALRAINRGLSLPDAAITVVHRSDGAGTTYAFTDFLAKTSQEWKSAVGVGSTVKWPTGLSAAGNDGVASMVQVTPYSIGYVELTYAIQRELSYGAVRNAAGAYVLANLESVAAAAQSAAQGAEIGPNGISIVNAPGKATYPIASFTWILLPSPVPTGSHAPLASLLEWMLTSGQKQSASLGYTPLPHELVARELQQLARMK